MFIINMFSTWREDPMESPTERRNEKGVFLSFFFSYNDSPGAARRPKAQQEGHRQGKQRALQLHACGPLSSPRGPTKTNINVGSLLQD